MRVTALLLLTAAVLANGRVAAQEEAAPPPAAAAEAAPDAATATAGAQEDYAMSASELAELGLAAEGDEAPVDTAIKLNGFVDFGMIHAIEEEWRRGIQPHPSFFIGNFNLYIAKNLTNTVRMFSEVRFSYLPNGWAQLGTNTVVSTLVDDYTEFGKTFKWGGLEIQRVYLEWSITPWLQLRVGQFLTPYGIWNVDHGSPTLIQVARPYVIARSLFPERQTGFELRGRIPLSSEHAVGYHLTLSNGFGPVSEYRDLDDNKAIGARAYWVYEGLGQLTIGASGFVGTDADAQLTVGLDANGKVKYGEKVNMKADVLSLAADFQWSYSGFLIQGEVVSRQLAYKDAGRPVITHPLSGVRMALRDTFDFGGYLLTGYRFDWLGVMPYVALHHVNYIEPTIHVRPKVYALDIGLNIRPIESVVLKVQYQYAHFAGGFIVSNKPNHIMFFQLAWAF